MEAAAIELVGFVVSPLHRYEGRPADGPVPSEGNEQPERIEIRAGLGIVGDRFFAQRAHRPAAITLFAVETLEHIAVELGAGPFDPADTRRNIIVRGADVDALAGRTFAIEQGGERIEFQGGRPANPCAWMDVVLAPGAFRAMRRRGGVRTAPLTNGVLHTGPARLILHRADDMLI
ncbi:MULTISPECIES: MOSC domain-containing protein [unclassified Rathayibacter]|uniref:MOSC domain-containing protein n=1 Tax=unclassified Rathayibacter TaxID=2609250 RepID=UPI000CE775DF|nr:MULTISPECIES: MOSC domain-containing protein [unclassified Rathayibacter]PPI20171.1 molybdenum cofactor biosysynthesis protein [Rathayibacter sp. AY1B6]PPI27239.1 molybdenum cofactor biosysynthesis protein [Rathayibacter sp. AY1B5]PPI31125.1 molybdenum cofactor biosysynthesis protein [Rathayibacter sp. AY1B1]